MKRINKNYSYKEKLRDMNIKIVPLEEYKGTETKIKHKCTCGNIWSAKPLTVLRNVKCGCKNNSNYIKKLIEKNIQVIPIEDYKGSHTKQLHKCTCGNEYYIKPNTLLSSKSLCNKCRTYNYNDKLKIKEIKIYPLEEYKGSLTKIKHKCTCGNEWNVKPAQVLGGGKCMLCKEKIDRLFFIGKKTILYSFNIPETKLYKIGITTTSVKTRYKSVDITLPSDIIEIVYIDGGEAWDKESEIKEKYKHFLYKGDTKYVGTKNTEVFTENILSNILV